MSQKIKIENFAEHPWEFPRGPRSATRLVIPRGGIPMGETKGGFVPGTAEVSEDDLQAMLAHPVARSWFGREGLVAPAAAVEKAKAAIAAEAAAAPAAPASGGNKGGAAAGAAR